MNMPTEGPPGPASVSQFNGPAGMTLADYARLLRVPPLTMILLTYKHDCYPPGCPDHDTIVYRLISTYDSAYEKPDLFCRWTNNIMKLVETTMTTSKPAV